MLPTNSLKLLLRHRCITPIAIVIFSLFITILLIDLFYFFILDRKIPGYKPGRFFQFDLLTGHSHKPNSEGYWYPYNDGTKFYVRINSFGFADSERKIIPTKPRIALIGDSTTEFWEADEPYRGQYVIESLLNNRFEVLNLGVRDYGTDQTYILFTNIGIHFSPGIVIYTFCINDINDNVNSSSKPFFSLDPKKPNDLILQGYPIKMRSLISKSMTGDDFLYNSFTYRKLSLFFRTLFEGPDGSHITLENNFWIRPYKKVYDNEDFRRMKITTKLISFLDEFAKAHGMKFLLVEGVYKHPLDDGDRAGNIRMYGDIFDFDKVSKVFESYSQENGIEFLSLPRLIRDRGVRVADLIHPEDIMHLNKRGIQFYAESVVGKLRSLGWLDEK